MFKDGETEAQSDNGELKPGTAGLGIKRPHSTLCGGRAWRGGQFHLSQHLTPERRLGGGTNGCQEGEWVVM